MTTLVVIAKECVPGRVKTRLHPAFSFEEAALIAAACLDDTLAAVDALDAERRILFFDGENAPDSAAEWEVIPQPVGTLDQRLAAIFDLVTAPTLLIGMDTPHLDPAVLAPVFTLWPDSADAWFGPATDGGFWALGMREPRGCLVRGVPMSRDDTGAVQKRRLLDAGLRVHALPQLTDIDTAGDLQVAAARSPALARILAELPARSVELAR